MVERSGWSGGGRSSGGKRGWEGAGMMTGEGNETCWRWGGKKKNDGSETKYRSFYKFTTSQMDREKPAYSINSFTLMPPFLHHLLLLPRSLCLNNSGLLVALGKVFSTCVPVLVRMTEWRFALALQQAIPLIPLIFIHQNKRRNAHLSRRVRSALVFKW